jgi:hypothetical protein
MRRFALCTAIFALAACKAEDPTTTESPTTDATTDTTTATEAPTGTTADEPTSTTDDDPTYAGACDGLTIPVIDESSCKPLATDYTPRSNNSADDMWPACVSDSGPYTLVDKSPSTIARIVAYENIAELLWRNGEPTPADFTAARNEYVLAEGLESRVVRREDLHYPPIPEAEWDPQVDPDKQCTVTDLATKHAQRCVGPALMQPLIDGAFAAGQAGEGDPKVHAARIHAGLLWFLYLSTYKEANTCATVAPKDCDSAWSYYTGGEPLEGGIGMAAEVLAISDNTHARIHDGIMAVRCWRDINQDDMGMYPLLDAVSKDQQDLFERGWEQLDQGLHRGFALIVRDHLRQYVNAICDGADADGLWAFLQVAGPVLGREAQERDPVKATILADLWASTSPSPSDIALAITALDEIFPCP